ncbi:C4-dicarboxylate TRAP transporter substrate-binding protein [Rhodoligotrophos defluvii]|uniref:C4-dicarboxylate TRAP transporter substrate-binding protein n=1 Tax=Rhodoligotrophos defluvii TaxID=2561934 RepID=UPI001485109E|nr:C4-dicarboxylate TRAP transporter substrate-binding protein [Rhodoligotrophos defluvii]
MKQLLACLALTLALIGGATTPSASVELVFAHGYPTTHPLSVTYDRFIAYVKDNSDIKLTVHPGGSLLNLMETSPGLRDGVADIGTVLTPYYLAEFPNSNLIANLSMLVTAGQPHQAPGAVMAGATMEYIFNCKDCQADYAAQNQVYLGSLSTAGFDLLCREPIRAIGGVKGKRLRSAAANFGRWAEHFGGIQVSVPANEIYEALSQGIVDCAMNSISELTGYQLHEVIRSATIGFLGGVFAGVDPHNVNRETWQGLSEDHRKVLLEASARGVAAATANYYRVSAENIKKAPGMGVEIIKATDEMIAANNEFVQKDIAVIEQQFTREYRVKDAARKIEHARGLIDRWRALLANWDGTEESLYKLYNDEIFSKIDVSTYAMK